MFDKLLEGCDCGRNKKNLQGLINLPNGKFFEELFPLDAKGARSFNTVIHIDLKSSLFLTGVLLLSGYILKKI